MKTQDVEFTQHFTDTTFGNCYPGKIARDVPAEKAKTLIANGLAQEPGATENNDEGYEALTVKELKAELDAREIEYARENKGGLIALLEADDNADEDEDEDEGDDDEGDDDELSLEDLKAAADDLGIEYEDDVDAETLNDLIEAETAE